MRFVRLSILMLKRLTIPLIRFSFRNNENEQLEWRAKKQTRRTRIDPLLKLQGWTIKPFDEAQPLAWSDETRLRVSDQPRSADYALMH